MTEAPMPYDLRLTLMPKYVYASDSKTNSVHIDSLQLPYDMRHDIVMNPN